MYVNDLFAVSQADHAILDFGHMQENLSSSHRDLQRVTFRHSFAVYNGQRSVAERNRSHAEHVRHDPNKRFACNGRRSRRNGQRARQRRFSLCVAISERLRARWLLFAEVDPDSQDCEQEEQKAANKAKDADAGYPRSRGERLIGGSLFRAGDHAVEERGFVFGFVPSNRMWAFVVGGRLLIVMELF
jgi:hypothetical protein